MKKQDKNLSSVHDKFFKFVFSDKAKVENYLQGTLSDELKHKILFDTLQQDQNSYVDEELNSHYADMVYDVIFDKNTPIKIAFLFEHKSFVPKFPHLQLMKYMIRIWEYQLQNKEPLKPVLPIIIYHGRSKWKQKSFEAYFEMGKIDESIKPYMPIFDYWLTDLKQADVKTIEQKYSLLSLRMAFLLMKYIFDNQLDKHLEEIFSGWKELIKDEKGKQYLHVILLYLHNSPKATQKDMKEYIAGFFTEDDIIPGTLAWDNLQKAKKERKKAIIEGKKEGKKEGIKEGIKEGELRKTVQGIGKLLQKGKLSIEEIADVFEVDTDFVLKVSKGEIK